MAIVDARDSYIEELEEELEEQKKRTDELQKAHDMREDALVALLGSKDAVKNYEEQKKRADELERIADNLEQRKEQEAIFKLIQELVE